MPISSIFYLRPMTDVWVRPNTGRQVHAAFLSLLDSINSDQAKIIHDQHNQKPFTISNLKGKRDFDGQMLKIKSGTLCHIRITFLQDYLFNELAKLFHTNSEKKN